MMHEEIDQHHNSGNQHEPFEREDLSPGAILGFLIGLAVVCVLVAVVLKAAYWAMDRYDSAHQPAASPLVKATSDPEARRATPRRATGEKIKESFPEPRLEENERGELNDVRLREEQELNSYGWVDEKAGVAHIPIERAMELTAQRGLPVHPRAGTTPPSPVNTAREAATREDRSRTAPKPQEKQP